MQFVALQLDMNMLNKACVSLLTALLSTVSSTELCMMYSVSGQRLTWLQLAGEAVKLVLYTGP